MAANKQCRKHLNWPSCGARCTKEDDNAEQCYSLKWHMLLSVGEVAVSTCSYGYPYFRLVELKCLFSVVYIKTFY